MKTAWSVYSGGRLNHQITGCALFTVKFDDTLDGILLRSDSMKQVFARKLRRKLSALTVQNYCLYRLSLDFQSAVVVAETGGRYVELSVVIMDEVNDEMLWYFMLRSPENCISQLHLDEIVSLILSRLAPEKVMNKHKYCL